MNQKKFLEEELARAKRELFMTSSLKRIRFLQRKINYLRKRLKEK
jgi:hypothetical protein